jgi:hypothetical protein
LVGKQRWREQGISRRFIQRLEHLFPRCHQIGGNPHQILFGNSDHDDLFWYRGCEGSQPAGSARVGRNHQYGPIRFRRLHQRRREHIKI